MYPALLILSEKPDRRRSSRPCSRLSRSRDFFAVNVWPPPHGLHRNLTFAPTGRRFSLTCASLTPESPTSHEALNRTAMRRYGPGHPLPSRSNAPRGEVGQASALPAMPSPSVSTGGGGGGGGGNGRASTATPSTEALVGIHLGS